MHKVLLGLLWLALAAFVYAWLTNPGAGFAWALILGLVAAFVVLVLLSRRWLALNDKGFSLLMAGETEAARKMFERAQKKALLANQRQLAAYNLAVAHLTLGEVDTALSLMLPVEKRRGLRFSPAYDRILPNQLALAYALKGDLAAAKQWLSEGERRRGDAPANFSLVAEVIVLCRDGHPGAAARLPSAKARDAEMMTVRNYKLLKLIEAFALHLEDPSGNAAAIDAALGGARPLDPQLLRGFTRTWPELRAFVEQRQVSEPRASAA